MASEAPTLLAMNVYLASRVGKTARARVGDLLAVRGLRLWHLTVLASLSDFGPHSQRQLAARARLDPSDLVTVLDELLARGLITKDRDEADRRRSLVSLTAEGATEFGVLIEATEDAQDFLLGALSDSERRTLHRLLLRVFADQIAVAADRS